jgi:hypothetical protein
LQHRYQILVHCIHVFIGFEKFLAAALVQFRLCPRSFTRLRLRNLSGGVPAAPVPDAPRMN